jgi:hypothetical protein
LHLNPEDIALAEACGVTFLPATPAQVQRFAMQRKIFYADRQPILATRGNGLYETVGTLQRLIEEGLQQQRDLATWHGATAPSPTSDVVPAEPPPNTALNEAKAEDAVPVEPEPAPKRTPRRRAEAAAAQHPLPPMILQAPLPVSPSSRPVAAASLAEGATRRSAQHGQRWLMAGAARRGRAAKHWSTRQR